MRTLTLILSLTLFAAVSCAQLQVTRNETATAGHATEHRLHSFVWGFVPGPRLAPISTLCPQGRFASAQLAMSATDVLVTVATLGIYVPHRAKVSCVDSPNLNLTP